MIKYYLKDDEIFYVGVINDGVLMPFDKDSIYEINLLDWHSGNQACGLLFSNHGNIFYGEKAFKFGFYKGELYILSDEVKLYHIDGDIKDIYCWICSHIFKKACKTPTKEMFIHPQFNTWIEMGKDVSEEKVLNYAHEIINHNYQPGVLMIDDCWSIDYGNWEFDPHKFNNPKLMIKKLHDLGFKVILWLCPFIDFTSKDFTYLKEHDLLVKNTSKEPFPAKWWNGISAVLDLGNPGAKAWIKSKLDYLIKEYEVDGFKLDAGDPEWYRGDAIFYKDTTIADQAKIWCEIGEQYPYSELRVGFNNGISCIAHRLRDKYHSWDKDGLNTLIPNAIMMGLCGYPYLCPDMIGGGVLPDFEDENFKFDEELFVRYAQVAALMPMMQFSLAPWKCLNKENQKIVLDAVKLHEEYAPRILELVKKAKDGTPIIQSLYYHSGDISTAHIQDEFFLGDDILVCPQIRKENKRKIIIPEGIWMSDENINYKKGCYEINTPLGRLPIFKKIK